MAAPRFRGRPLSSGRALSSGGALGSGGAWRPGLRPGKTARFRAGRRSVLGLRRWRLAGGRSTVWRIGSLRQGGPR